MKNIFMVMLVTLMSPAFTSCELARERYGNGGIE